MKSWGLPCSWPSLAVILWQELRLLQKLIKRFIKNKNKKIDRVWWSRSLVALIFGCSQQFSCGIVDYCTIFNRVNMFSTNSLIYQSSAVFTPSRSSAILTCSLSEQMRTGGSWWCWRSPRRVEKPGVRSGWNPATQRARIRRDTELAPWQSAGSSVGYVQPRGPPPAVSSIYSSGSGTRFWPESLSGAGMPPAPLSPSCSGTVSRRRWTPAETPDCGWTRSGSSSSG